MDYKKIDNKNCFVFENDREEKLMTYASLILTIVVAGAIMFVTTFLKH